MQTRDLMHAKEILKLSYSQQRNYLKLDHVRNILFLPVEEAALGAQALAIALSGWSRLDPRCWLRFLSSSCPGPLLLGVLLDFPLPHTIT